MDLYHGKKPLTSGTITRKRSGFASKNASDSRSQESEFCNRIGCNGRLKYSKNTLIGFTGKSKSSRPSSCSSNIREYSGCSSITSKSINGDVSQHVSHKESSVHLGTDLPHSSKIQRRLDDNSLNQARFQTKNKGSSFSNASSSVYERSNVASRRQPVRNPASSTSTASSTIVHNSGLAIKENNIGIQSSLRTPGVVLKSESNVSRKRVFKDRNPEGESSSSSNSNRDTRFYNGVTGVTKSSSTHSRNLSSNTDFRSAASRSLRSTVSQTRSILSNRDMSSASSLGQSTRVKPQSPQFDPLVEATANRPSVDSSAQEFTSLELYIPHDLDGIAEMLMSLQRIGQGAELTYEQLMSFESNLFSGSYQWYDRHRDMRLDIDNMSYEELLALEERMGNVSTAISEEALSTCIRKSIYRNPSAQLGFSSGNESENDVKCSVCQEEYRVGEEIGKLDCEHRYHVDCIEQWLGLKNWCPICKKAVVGGGAPPSSSATSTTSQFKR